MREVFDVMLVSPTSRGMGGIAQHVEGLANRLAGRGYRVCTVSSENTPIVRFKGLRNPSFMVSSTVRSFSMRARVVHAHNIPAAPAMRFSDAGRRVLTLHGVYAEQVGLLHGGLLGAAASLAERVSVRWADVSTTVSRQVAKAYRKLGLEVVYVPNAVDVAGDDLEAFRVGEVQAVYVGRLSREKNVEAVVELARRIPGATFLVVGDGPEAGRLREKAKEVKNIVFTGGVSRRIALKYIKGSDVLVLPSLMEGLSTVVLEAMAMKTPVVASNVGGNVELIQDGRTGLLVNPRDVDDLTEAVSTILNDRPLARRIAENAYQHFLENYSWDVVLPRYLKVYGLE